MAYCNEVPSIVIPDHPNVEFDGANELKGEAYDTPIDPEKLAAMTYPPEERELVSGTPNYDLDPNRDPNFNPVIGRA